MCVWLKALVPLKSTLNQNQGSFKALHLPLDQWFYQSSIIAKPWRLTDTRALLSQGNFGLSSLIVCGIRFFDLKFETIFNVVNDNLATFHKGIF